MGGRTSVLSLSIRATPACSVKKLKTGVLGKSNWIDEKGVNFNPNLNRSITVRVIIKTERKVGFLTNFRIKMKAVSRISGGKRFFKLTCRFSKRGGASVNSFCAIMI